MEMFDVPCPALAAGTVVPFVEANYDVHPGKAEEVQVETTSG